MDKEDYFFNVKFMILTCPVSIFKTVQNSYLAVARSHQWVIFFLQQDTH